MTSVFIIKTKHIKDTQYIEASVSEDGENGCTITYNTHQPSLSIKI